jgi:type VI secretion system VasD/TssJ family lipoprotein
VRNCIHFMIMLAFGLLLGSCATPQTVKTGTEWGFEPNAIRVNLTADSGLNFYEGIPHTAVVWVYQLTNPNKFNQLTDDRTGLTKLLEGGQFDPTVGDFKREFVQPGRSVSMTLDRAEGAKYVAVVAGYYSLQKESSTRLVQIPVVEVTQGNVLISKPARIKLDVYLGPQGIQKVDLIPQEGQQPGRK